MMDVSSDTKEVPYPSGRWGKMERTCVLFGVSMVATAGILAYLGLDSSEAGFWGALLLAIGVALGLVGVIARVTRDISQRLDLAQSAAEAIEDRVEERLDTYADAAGVPRTPRPKTARVPHPDPWQLVRIRRQNAPTTVPKRCREAERAARRARNGCWRPARLSLHRANGRRAVDGWLRDACLCGSCDL